VKRLIAWRAALSLIGFLWALAVYNREPVK
jgi:hypothetical protein